MKLTVAFLAPLVCGAKAICTRQLAPMATVLPTGQVVPVGATAKLAASGPVKVSCDRVRAALPRFRRVIGWGPASAGPTVVGEKLISKEQVARGGIGVPMQGSEP